MFSGVCFLFKLKIFKTQSSVFLNLTNMYTFPQVPCPVIVFQVCREVSCLHAVGHFALQISYLLTEP